MKRIVIDLQQRTERVKQGVFPIQALAAIGPAWYMERVYIGHPRIGGARSFLIPSRCMWVMFFRSTDGRHSFETYIHACHVCQEGELLQIDDLYADVIRFWDGTWTVVDLDEMAAAVRSGQLSRAQVAAGLKGMEEGIRLLTRAGVGELEDWLRRDLSAPAKDGRGSRP